MSALKTRILRDIVVAPSGCWEWQGGLTEHGYARIHFERRRHYAHRAAYTIWVGPIPDGLEIDHLCRNRKCCNPEHLEAVTHFENLHRSPDTITSINAAKTHCLNGHEFTPDSTYVNPNTLERTCRTCRRERDRVAAFRAAGINPDAVWSDQRPVPIGTREVTA